MCLPLTSPKCIANMQILVDSRNTNYQRIVWQLTPGWTAHELSSSYRYLRHNRHSLFSPSGLKTIYRRWKCRISRAELNLFAVPVLHHQTYVDDCTFGVDDQILARQTSNQLIELLKKGGFRLRKWASNYPSYRSIFKLDPADHVSRCQALITQVTLHRERARNIND